MRVVGIAAEYNPFHSGHAYQLSEARRLAKADFVVVAMSPDFVQRGEPAVFGKYTRAEMALRAGADLVLELPVCYAAGSAEYFAQGAVSLLDGLGVVDVLCFGCEGSAHGSEREPKTARREMSDVAGLLWEIASMPDREDGVFSDTLRAHLARGVSYPGAWELALQSHLERTGRPPLPREFLAKPNNILAAEYCRAILKLRSDMEILPVKRAGSGYHEEELSGRFCSATALRREILSGNRSSIYAFVPEALHEICAEVLPRPAAADDLLPFLLQKLLTEDGFDHILDIPKSLSDRMRRLRYSCIGRSYEEITELLCTKQLTRARVRRALTHLLLDIRASAAEQFRRNGPAFYARVLGFRANAAPLLHEIKLRGTLPLLVKNADAAARLDELGLRMLRQDFDASHLYRMAQTLKYGTPFFSEYERSPVKI